MSVGGFREVERALDNFEAEIHRRTVAAGDEIGHYLANYAKTNHLWGNPYSEGYTPTGHTDQSTQGGVYEQTREFVRVVLSAGMDYDVWLELAMSQRWSWLRPAVYASERQIMQILERHLAGLF